MCGIDDTGRAEASCTASTVLHRIRDGDIGDSAFASPQEDRDADRACADHQEAIGGRGRSALDGMQPHRQRLDERTHHWIETFVQPDRLSGRHGDEFGERASARSETEW